MKKDERILVKSLIIFIFVIFVGLISVQNTTPVFAWIPGAGGNNRSFESNNGAMNFSTDNWGNTSTRFIIKSRNEKEEYNRDTLINKSNFSISEKGEIPDIVKGDRTIKVGGVKFDLSSRETLKLIGREKLNLVSKIVNKYNKSLSPNFKAKKVFISRDGMYAAWASSAHISLATRIFSSFSKQTLRDIVVHEMAHHIGFELSESSKWKQWKKLFNKAKDAKVTGVFKEKLFNDVQGCGHPSDSAHELFASTFNVIENYPGRIDKIMNNVAWGEPEKKRIAKKVIDFVRRIKHDY